MHKNNTPHLIVALLLSFCFPLFNAAYAVEGKPDAPSLTIIVTETTVNASWNPIESATGYTLYYAPYPSADPISSIDVGSTLGLEAELPRGATFYVAVQAYNAEGDSSISNIEILIALVEPTVDLDESVVTPISWKITGHLDLGWWIGETETVEPRDGGADVIASYDVNGDGYNDIVTGRVTFPFQLPPDTEPSSFPGKPIDIFFSDGNGNFSQAPSDYFQGGVHLSVHPREFVVADYNGDGVDDLFGASHGWDGDPFPGEQNFLLLSDGHGGVINATSTHLPQFSDFTHSAENGDIDGDGDIDILVGNLDFTEVAYFLINDGEGRFSRVELSQFVPFDDNNRLSHSLTNRLFDIDNDGDLDWFHLSPYPDGWMLFINDGEGNMSIAEGNPVPRPKLPFGEDNLYQAVDTHTPDLNGDGYKDLLVYSYDDRTFSERYVQVLINQKDGTFADETEVRWPEQPNDPEFQNWYGVWMHEVDINYDGYLDYLVQGYERDDGGLPSATVFLNDGKGFFSKDISGDLLPTVYWDDLEHERYLHDYIFSDFDADGIVDVAGFQGSDSASNVLYQFSLKKLEE